MSSLAGDSQISLILCRRILIAAIQLAESCSALYLARYCALKQNGTFRRKASFCVPRENEGTEREAPGPALGICHVHESYF